MLADLQTRLDEAGASLAAADYDVEALRSQLGNCLSELDGLRVAMTNRGVIEQAKGMLMLRLELDEADAFAYLREASNRTNRKVAEIASDVVRTRAGATAG